MPDKKSCKFTAFFRKITAVDTAENNRCSDEMVMHY